MKSHKLHRNKTLFARFFLSNLILFTAATAILSVLFYNLFLAGVTRQLHSLQYENARRYRSAAEQMIEQSRQLTKQLYFNNDINSLLYAREPDPFTRVKVQSLIGSYANLYGNLHSICLYNGNAKAYYTTDHPHFDTAAVARLTEDQIANFYQLVPREILAAGQPPRNVLSIFAYDRFSESTDILIAIIVNIDAEALRKALALDQNSVVLVMDERGVILSGGESTRFQENLSDQRYVQRILSGEAGGFTESVNGVPMLVDSAYSEDLGWHFVTLVPRDHVGQSALNTRNLIIAICLTVLVAGLIASAFISGRITSPLHQLAMKIQGQGGPSEATTLGRFDETAIVTDFYDQMEKRVEQLEALRETEQTRLRNEALASLLRGGTRTDASPTMAAGDGASPQSAAILPGDAYPIHTADGVESACQVVLLIHTEWLDNLRENTHDESGLDRRILQVLQPIVHHVLEPRFPCELTDMDGRLAAVIRLAGGESFPPELRDAVFTLRHEVEQRLGILITTAVGSLADCTAKLPNSFRHAEEAMRYRIVEGPGSILEYEVLSERNERTFQYPGQAEKLLLEAIRTGHQTDVDTALTQFFSLVAPMSYDFLMLSVYRLLFSVFIVAEPISGNDRSQPNEPFARVLGLLRRMESLEHVRRWFSNYIRFTLEKARESKRNGSASLRDELETWLGARYQEADLSVESAARHFGYNPIYFGKLFREQTGESFLEQLTRLRMTKAQELLAKSGMTIREISGIVGYANATYFTTSFKKRTGLTPNEYRVREGNK